jgi:hypothetical protein
MPTAPPRDPTLPPAHGTSAKSAFLTGYVSSVPLSHLCFPKFQSRLTTNLDHESSLHGNLSPFHEKGSVCAKAYYHQLKVALTVGAASQALQDRLGIGCRGSRRATCCGPIAPSGRQVRSGLPLLTKGNHLVTLPVTKWFPYNANIAMLYSGR